MANFMLSVDSISFFIAREMDSMIRFMEREKPWYQSSNQAIGAGICSMAMLLVSCPFFLSFVIICSMMYSFGPEKCVCEVNMYDSAQWFGRFADSSNIDRCTSTRPHKGFVLWVYASEAQ
jgi:hypothetical protein